MTGIATTVVRDEVEGLGPLGGILAGLKAARNEACLVIACDIPEIEALLASGERSILPLFERCRTVVVGIEDAGRIRNLNTRADYKEYLRSQSPGRRTKP